MKRCFPLLIALWLLVGKARADEGKVDPRIFAGVTQGESASFLVVLREQADLSGADAIRDPAQRRRFVFDALTDVALRTQSRLVAPLTAAGARWRSHYLVNMLEVEADRSVAAGLAGSEEVSYLAANRPALLHLPPMDREAGAAAVLHGAEAVGPNLVKIRAPDVWAQGFRGQGIVVGDADTGFVWDHPALKPHYRGFNGSLAVHDYNWHDAVHDAAAGNLCGSNAAAPCDDEGHGTSTAGLMVGDDGAGNSIGVAPGARLIGCRNMDRGAGTPARYTECFEFFLAPTDSHGAGPRPEFGADVINNSWGCPASEGCTDPNVLKAVVENVRAAGIFVVVSAGNGGSACSTVSEAPAIYGASFSIGATDDDDASPAFSSRGPVTVDGSNRLKPDLVAPGVGVRTSTRVGFTSGFTGTSAAAPHVAGGVALLWSAQPALRGDVTATEEILRASAEPLLAEEDCAPFSGLAVPNAVFGFGRLDALRAVVLASPPRRVSLRRNRGGATRVVPPRTP